MSLPNEKLTLLQNGESLKPIEDLINRAQKFVFVNMLYVSCDPETMPIIEKLEGRSREGIDVRLLLNRQFSLFSGACIRQMENAGIRVLKSETHSSYLVNDQDEAIIGSENLAKMSFASNGTNFMDRDLTIEIQGPIATDLMGNFIGRWADAGKAPETSLEKYLLDYRRKRADEISHGSRGEASYSAWFSKTSSHEIEKEVAKTIAPGLCRFASQDSTKGESMIADLLTSLIRNAKTEIRVSSVRIENSDIAKELLKKAANKFTVDSSETALTVGTGS